MFFTAVCQCSIWSDNISAEYKLEVTEFKKGGVEGTKDKQ
jgi:hypothetical protein